jgi:hypothetical protein
LAKPIGPNPQPDRTFMSITEKEVMDSGLLDRYSWQQVLQYQPITDWLVTSACISLTSDEKQQFESRVAVGSLDTGELNAVIVRSECGSYAILLHYGLFLFLDKYFKYLQGYHSPDSVAYCSAGDARQLTSSDYIGFASELVDAYKECLSPFGPLVKLRESERAIFSIHTDFCKLFVLCHELGHLFNGDLDEPSSVTPFRGLAGVMRLEGNRDHEREHAADIWGYGRMRSSIRHRSPSIHDLLVISPVILLFTLFHQLCGGASKTHPHPLARTRRIVECYYDAAFQDEILRMYREGGVTRPIWGPDEQMAQE